MQFNTNKAIYLQIAELLEQLIVRAEWPEGERISSVREMGISLAVNPATVLRAYDELSTQGIIEQRRGLGYFVMPGAVERVQSLKRGEFLQHSLPALFDAMDGLGISMDEVSERYAKRNGC